MAGWASGGKFYGLFTLFGTFWRGREVSGREGFAWSAVSRLQCSSPWSDGADPSGKIQMALVTSFILGIIGGLKSRG